MVSQFLNSCPHQQAILLSSLNLYVVATCSVLFHSETCCDLSPKKVPCDEQWKKRELMKHLLCSPILKWEGTPIQHLGRIHYVAMVQVANACMGVTYSTAAPKPRRRPQEDRSHLGLGLTWGDCTRQPIAALRAIATRVDMETHH